MSNHEFLTDEYVAELLAKDARESSIKYSTMGLQAFTSSKPPANKPKPNTRFLRNIIKGTDHHNAALQAKESAEARERFLSLPLDGTQQARKKVEHIKNVEHSLGLPSKGTQELKVHLNDRDIRKRQLGDIAEILHGRSIKRKKPEEKGKSTRRGSTFSEDHQSLKKSQSSRRDYEKSEKSCKAEKREHSKVTRVRESIRQASTSCEEYEDQKKSHLSRRECERFGKSSRSEKRETSRVTKDRRPTRRASTSSDDQEYYEKSRPSRRECERSGKSGKTEKVESSRVIKDRRSMRRASTSSEDQEYLKKSRPSRRECERSGKSGKTEKVESSRVIKDRRSIRRASISSDNQEDQKESRPSRKECEKSEKQKSSRVIKDRRFKSVLDVLGERKRHEEDRRRRLKSRSPSPRISSSRKYDQSSHGREHAPTGKEKNHHRSLRSHRKGSSRFKEPEGSQDALSKHTKIMESPEEVNFESDPLDDIIGPRPVFASQTKPRGRGAISHASEIDRHFSEVYDPSADIQIDLDTENDWDQALEAIRDRQKFKEKGVERLKSAGFTDKEIKRLERGRQSPEKDVKWVMQGERREWDRGKVIDSQGVLRFESKFGISVNDNINSSNYGRLKDT